MKKTISLLVSVLIISSVLCFGVSAAEQATAKGTGTIVVGSANVRAGDSFDIPITMTENPGIFAMSLDLAYDTDAFVLEEIEYHDEATSAYELMVNRSLAGRVFVYYEAHDPETISDNTKTGKIVTLKMKASDKAVNGEYNITCGFAKDGEAINTQGDGEWVNFNFKNGAVKVSGGNTAANTVAGTNNNAAANSAADATTASGIEIGGTAANAEATVATDAQGNVVSGEKDNNMTLWIIIAIIVVIIAAVSIVLVVRNKKKAPEESVKYEPIVAKDDSKNDENK